MKRFILGSLFLTALVFPAFAAAQDSAVARTVWLQVRTAPGSDIADWVVERVEQALRTEAGFHLITREERRQAAEFYARQPATRAANADSLLRRERQPDFWVELNFQPVQIREGRAGWAFVMGRRSVGVAADFLIRSERQDMPPLQGVLQADSSWMLEYCGLLECVNKPFPAVERLAVERSLNERLITQLKERIRLALTIPLRERQARADSLAAIPPAAVPEADSAAQGL